MDTKGLAIDARSLGSIATLEGGKFQGDTSGMFNGTDEYLTTYGWNGKFKDADNNYEEDVNQIKSLGLNATSGNNSTWLASRNISLTTSSLITFGVRYVSKGSSTTLRVSNYLFQTTFTRGNVGSNSTYRFCPVFLLSSDIVISSGDGSKENPYIIE